MGVNKVVYDGKTLIDISDSTLTAADLLEGLVAYNAKGERILGELKQMIIDSVMSDTSTNAVQNKVIKAYIDANSGGDFSTLFDIGLASEYHITDESEAPTIISNALNLSGFSQPIGTSGIVWKQPTVNTPTINWASTVDNNYDIVGTGEVVVSFGSAGSIKKNVTFKKPGPGKLYAAKMSFSNSYIDTGIPADYGYTYHSKGWAANSTSVLMGALVSTTTRATLRMLPSSNKIQAMWPTNKEVLGSSYGFDVNKEFEYWINANEIRIKQGSVDITLPMTGTTSSGLVGANIYLFNETTTSTQGNGAAVFNEVLQGDTVIARFAPYRLTPTDEVVLINTAGLTAADIQDIVTNGDGATYASRILRGDLEEVSSPPVV